LFNLPAPSGPGGSVRKSIFLSLLALLVQGGLSSQVAAADSSSAQRQREWKLELGLGAEYDSNVTVDEVDLSSGQGDYAQLLSLGVGVKQPLGQRSTFSLNYDINQSNYQEFSRVDRRTQILGADLSTDLGRSNAGFSAYFIDSRLDGDPFLGYLRLSPSLSGFLARKWFARGAYVYSERRIDDREQRDADTHSAEADLYYFQRGLRSYFNLGYRYRDEDAVAPELDFTAHTVKLRYIRRIDFGERRIKGEIALRYEKRDYRFPEPTIGERRDDSRLRLKADLEIPLVDHVFWQFYASYGDYQSNLPRADFSQSIVGTRVELRW
jgi:hypothetical protein